MKLIFAVIALFCSSIVWSAGPASPSAARAVVKGEVMEVKDVGSYSYLRIKAADGEVWAAVAKTPVKNGEKVTIEDPALMTNFESVALKKTFDKIYFGRLAGAAAPMAAAPMAASAGAANPHGAVPPAAAVGDVKVAKASGPDAKTVAEVVTKSAQLKGKTVVVRGKVVKFTPEVMGKNWIHLRDGTGSAADKSDDVLVTTKDMTKVGDVVVVKGVVQTDKDFGSGYSYKVIIEDSTLGK